MGDAYLEKTHAETDMIPFKLFNCFCFTELSDPDKHFIESFTNICVHLKHS